MILIKDKKVQDWQMIENIFDDGVIKLKNNNYVKILKVKPINYNLKSDLEKKSILNSYKIFLKTCNFDIQILIQSSKQDLNSNILNIRKNIKKEKNNYLNNLASDYIEYIKKLNLNKKSSSKNFYIIISNKKIKEKEYFESEEIIKNDLKEKYFKIKDGLLRCGNNVIEINEKKEVKNIIFSFFNTRKYLNK